ncbi:MAG: citrate lyase holo-[acyl-carrier protein] synthase [Clostridiaceae bacterium]|jgi:holo-ACP synthase/triphosphoribosyl-dephospho-CoA synthase|nr:citrate lyase holo-[acyl-carrier protein] synthase [Clostridiaceae bacterium]
MREIKGLKNYAFDQRVELDEMLRARDQRLERQKHFLKETGLPLLSVTLNIPGDIKRTRLSSLFFKYETKRLQDALEGLGARIARYNFVREKTGDEAIYAVEGLSVRALKQLAMTLEARCPASRLLDLDVIDKEGVQINRSSLGFPPRSCLLCDQPASICARSRAHSKEALDREIKQRLEQAVAEEMASRMAAFASEASSFELMVSKKPGLVTMRSSGSHDDMNRFTFGRAQSGFFTYYEAAFRVGFFATGEALTDDCEKNASMIERASGRSSNESCSLTIAAISTLSLDDANKLRLEGVFAERRMLESTGGVNTHRGWIYMSGVLLAAMGLLYRRVLEEDTIAFATQDDLKKVVQSLIVDVARSLENVVDASPIFEKVKSALPVASEAVGVRKEALRGFPSIMETGLQVMASCCRETTGVDDAGREDALGRRVFLALLGAVEDTTLRKRGGDARAEALRTFLLNCWISGDHRIPDEPDEWRAALINADDASIDSCLSSLELQFAEEGLTAGGTADALAGTRLIYAFLQDITNVLLFWRLTP